MSEPETFPAPVLEMPPPGDKWEREYLAYVRLLPALLQSHRDKYVAIHEEKLVDSGDDLVPLALRVYAKHGYVPIYMDLVSERTLPPLRMPHYRILNGR